MGLEGLKEEAERLEVEAVAGQSGEENMLSEVLV